MHFARSENRTICVQFLWFASKFIRLVYPNALTLGLEISDVILASSFVLFSFLDSEFDNDVPSTWQLEFV